MEQIKLKATLRDGKGKQAVKKMRTGGLVPGIVYHRGEEPVSIAVDNKEISKILHAHGNENILINLSIEKEKKKSRAVIIKEIQHHPVKRSILHVDFNEISLTEQITVEVEVVGVGEPIGVKQDGGFLDHPLREIKIQCLPTDIPPHIDVDVSNLKMNDSIHVKDLKVSEKIKVLTDPELLLFQVKKHEEAVEEPAGAAETPEVEVIREKKEEDGAKSGEESKSEAKKEAGKSDKK